MPKLVARQATRFDDAVGAGGGRGGGGWSIKGLSPFVTGEVDSRGFGSAMTGIVLVGREGFEPP